MAEHHSKTRLMNAALNVVRTKGYSATRVDDICAAAGVTKGSFFHHFASKDDLALAAVDVWREMAGSLFTEAGREPRPDPLDRLLAYIDLRKALMAGDLAVWTCYAGTMIQETYATHPTLRDACEQSIAEHVATLTEWVEAAMRHHGVAGEWSAESLAFHVQAVLQGAFILAKGQGEAEVARDSGDHLRRYVELLFHCREVP